MSRQSYVERHDAETHSFNQKLVLQALAAEPGRPLASSYGTRHELPSVATVQSALRALIERELVAKPDGSQGISEPFFAEWILALDEGLGEGS